MNISTSELSFEMIKKDLNHKKELKFRNFIYENRK